MISRWWLLAAAWTSAGVILTLLGHPIIGGLQATVGIGVDTAIQSYLRRRLVARVAPGSEARDRGLGRLVLLRFTLGMIGVLAICLWRPSTSAACVLVLMQAWFLCVAVVQFAHSPRLMVCALVPVQLALWLGLGPLASVDGAAAIYAAVCLLSGVVFAVAREMHQLSWTWILSTRRNLDLQRELIDARDLAVRANLAKSQFLAAMSHEIRTPLNGLLGMADVMADHRLDPAQRRRLAIVRQSGDDLMAVLNDILDLSKVEAGRLVLEDEAFALEDVLTAAHAAFSGVAQTKGLTYVLESRVGPVIVRGDAARLRQILNNLLSNALKFTERGEVMLFAAYEEGRLTVEVSDTGCGMAPETLARLFEPYAQASAATARTYGGAGLGLSIARHLAELMGGALEASSEERHGSRFTLTAPLAVATRPLAAATPEPAASLASQAIQTMERLSSHAPLRVLAADDHPVNRLVLAALLKQIDVEPVMVANGREAVDAWLESPWDLILMDVQMPVLDGVQATCEIRALESQLGRPRTPIVALTAHTLSHHLADYRTAGMDDLVAKPIAPARLFAAVESAVSPKPAPAIRAA